MAISWLTALKVIPWGDVIEHAPKVLGAARKLMDRQTPADGPHSPAPAGNAPDTLAPTADALQQQVRALQGECERLAHTQQQLTQTVADLAEQNARLVSAVEVLRLRSRLLLGSGAVMAVVLVWLLWR